MIINNINNTNTEVSCVTTSNTFAEVAALIAAGKNVVLRVPASGEGRYYQLSGKNELHQDHYTFTALPFGTLFGPEETQMDGYSVDDSGTWTHVSLPAFATMASPTFTGTPTAPTPVLGDETTKIATTAFVANTIKTNFSNRNLLHNPYFRIDQRQGYVIPPNTIMFESGTTNTWTTDGYYQVTGWHYDASTPPAKYADIVVNGTTWSCGEAYAVRGYVCSGTTRINDCWKVACGSSNTAVVLVNDDGSITFKRLSGSGDIVVSQNVEQNEIKNLRGHNATISILLNGNITTWSWAVASSGNAHSGNRNVVNGVWFSMEIGANNYAYYRFYSYGGDTTEITISATKLEYGTISTLQTEMDNGSYNEDLDLWECQYYLQPFELETYLSARVWGSGSTANAVALLPLKRTMRLIRPTLQWVSGIVNVFWEGNGQWNLTPTTTNETKADNIAQIYIPLSPTTLDVKPATAWFNDVKFFLSAEI